MRTKICSAIATTLPLLFCLINTVNASRHRHQSSHQSDSLSTSAESSTATYSPESRTTKSRPAEIQFNVAFDSSLPRTSPNEVKDFMHEFLSRGLYACSAKYADNMLKIKKLIAEAYADYKECDTMVKNTPKTYPKTGFESFDELLSEWESEDGEDEDDGSIEVNSVSDLRPKAHRK